MKTKWVILVAAAAAAVGLSGDGLAAPGVGPLTEVVVTLKPAALLGRSLESASGRSLVAEQAAVVRTVQASLPEADVRWRYHLVLDGFAVSLPASQVGKLASLPGVAKVWPNVVYHALDGVTQIGAPALWGPTLATAGQGMKIGFIDDGIDASHPYFNPAGFQYPPGFPKGQTKFTTPKVIVQRAFPAPHQGASASLPYDPVNSDHADHVAGIAAGDHGTNAHGRIISGVAPDAYIGNYKALTVLTPDFGLDGNSAEIAAAIEAAVSDGMNVINMSFGEPEVEPSRDLVDLAIDNAARAGVVPVVAAGNEFGSFGKGSVGSPGNASSAITVAAVDSHNVIADFSSSGPTPLSLQMKPDVAAPGVSIFSAAPPRLGTWRFLDGTSMAAPHVAAGAALLLQRHPTWTVAQVKSALVLTGDPARSDNGVEAPTTREGGGVIDLPRADNPLVFAAPTGLSFGELKPGLSAARTVTLTDAGGGAGDWTASVQLQGGDANVTVPPTVTVPGSLAVTATAGTTTGDATGFVVLTHGADTRRIPFWLDVSAPKLGTEKTIALSQPGIYRGTLVGAPSRVNEYRYPTGGGTHYPGPERVYRVRVTGRPANFGVVVLSGHVFPHVTFAGSEDHLAGLAGLPIDLNPYRQAIGTSVPAAGVVLPGRGTYDIVFDSRSAAPGPFTFRYWVDDTKPPTALLVSTKGGVTYRVTDAGSGVAKSSINVTVDNIEAPWTYVDGRLHVTVPKGRHTIVVKVSDWQETKNMEDVPPVLPNTTTLRTTVRIT